MRRAFSWCLWPRSSSASIREVSGSALRGPTENHHPWRATQRLPPRERDERRRGKRSSGRIGLLHDLWTVVAARRSCAARVLPPLWYGARVAPPALSTIHVGAHNRRGDLLPAG